MAKRKKHSTIKSVSDEIKSSARGLRALRKGMSPAAGKKLDLHVQKLNEWAGELRAFCFSVSFRPEGTSKPRSSSQNK